MRISDLRNQVRQLLELAKRQQATQNNPFAKYRTDPAGYIREVCGSSLTDKQEEICQKLVTPPFRVMVKAAHSVGKTRLGGGLVSWFYDTHNPGVCLTTAPSARQVRDQLWKEVRKQRKDKSSFVGPKMPRLEDAADHFAHGFTAEDANSFQGQHEGANFLIFDEAVGVDAVFWEAAETMCQGENYYWICFFNPTDTTSQAYVECANAEGRWHVVEMPAIEHPNIGLELAGHPPMFPAAIRLKWLQERLDRWSERIHRDDRKPGDIEFPPGSNIWFRPGPLAEARLLARWPTTGAGVWSEGVWNLVESCMAEPQAIDLPEIGVDVARFGADFTTFHVRCGPQRIFHESRNGWSTAQKLPID